MFYFRQHRAPGQKIAEHEYEEGIKKISSVSSVRMRFSLNETQNRLAYRTLFEKIESFWSLLTHLNTPSELQPTTDYLFFHSGVRRPVWEDPLNIQGGKWILRLKKGVADRLWEELLMAIVSDQFDDCGSANSNTGNWRSGGNTDQAQSNGLSSSENDPEICGCTLSVRQHEDILTLWNKHGLDSAVNERVKYVSLLLPTDFGAETVYRETITKVLRLPENTSLIYKTNNGALETLPLPRLVTEICIDSMQDKSSFRTPQTRTPMS